MTWSEKITWHRMSQVVKVYAALRGIKKGNNDMTCYYLILKLKNGQTLKILETKNASKIRREVSHQICPHLTFLLLVNLPEEILGARG